MDIFENVRLAWEGLKANKMRALLTMLGIIIGIASVIGILTVGNGLAGSVTASMSTLGASNITVMLQERGDAIAALGSMFSGGSGIEEEDLMTNEMIDELRNRYPEAIAGISLTQSAGSGQAKLGRHYANLSISGVNEEHLSVNSIDIIAGRDLLRRDIDGTRNVCVVSDKLVNNLYDGKTADALGQELIVYIGNDIYAYSVVGVYKYEASAMSFSMASEKDIQTNLYIPVTTAKKMVGADSGYSSITICASNSVDSAEFARRASSFLNRYYENNDNYRVSALSMETMLDSLNSMMDTISIALSVIAGISLLVGGIGVMNIMLVSVTERTREIGTRKALGATNSAIRMQFVVESMIVCLIGGVIGIILGAVLGYVGSSLIDTPALPSVSSIAIAVGFSLAIGIFFGYYPANKAAMLDPIEALRYE
ncbi:MAG: FtsX-like permease family protein [Clostridiales bacterium]|nr:FtsX-like permease family protein [Clostridiales bacterium]